MATIVSPTINLVVDPHRGDVVVEVVVVVVAVVVVVVVVGSTGSRAIISPL
jgi:hypothetical protein